MNWRAVAPMLGSGRGGCRTRWIAGQQRRSAMAKAYWIACYRSIKDPNALAEYAKLGGPAITAGGGRFLARGMPSKTYEIGMNQRTVLIEFDSVAQAMATHDS